MTMQSQTGKKKKHYSALHRVLPNLTKYRNTCHMLSIILCVGTQTQSQRRRSIIDHKTSSALGNFFITLIPAHALPPLSKLQYMYVYIRIESP